MLEYRMTYVIYVYHHISVSLLVYLLCAVTQSAYYDIKNDQKYNFTPHMVLCVCVCV